MKERWADKSQQWLFEDLLLPSPTSCESAPSAVRIVTLRSLRLQLPCSPQLTYQPVPSRCEILAKAQVHFGARARLLGYAQSRLDEWRKQHQGVIAFR